jgi:hypothetical protein
MQVQVTNEKTQRRQSIGTETAKPAVATASGIVSAPLSSFRAMSTVFSEKYQFFGQLNFV